MPTPQNSRSTGDSCGRRSSVCAGRREAQEERLPEPFACSGAERGRDVGAHPQPGSSLVRREVKHHGEPQGLAPFGRQLGQELEDDAAPHGHLDRVDLRILRDSLERILATLAVTREELVQKQVTDRGA